MIIENYQKGKQSCLQSMFQITFINTLIYKYEKKCTRLLLEKHLKINEIK